jgi:hypothetical protein
MNQQIVRTKSDDTLKHLKTIVIKGLGRIATSDLEQCRFI